MYMAPYNLPGSSVVPAKIHMMCMGTLDTCNNPCQPFAALSTAKATVAEYALCQISASLHLRSRMEHFWSS